MQDNAAFLVFRYNSFLHFSAKHASHAKSANLRKLDVAIRVNGDIDDNGRIKADSHRKTVARHKAASSQGLVGVRGRLQIRNL
jgi:hypothetical protein